MDRMPRRPNLKLLMVICGVCVSCLCVLPTTSLAQTINTNSVNGTSAPEVASIEQKVLGPLRVWHIVFIVSFLLLIVMVAAFCCVEIRVPRSREEIEANYQKRLLNQKYCRMLERTPEQLMNSTEFQSETEISVISPSTSSGSGEELQSARRAWSQVAKGAMSKFASRKTQEEDDEDWQGCSSSMPGGRPPTKGKPTPLAINPRDIIALMAQQKKVKQ